MAKSTYDITPGSTFADAALVTLRKQAAEMLRNLDGTRQGDMDAVHDMRVASRRLRAAMSVFGDVYHKRKFKGLEGEVSRVTDALGAVRDADVMIDYLSRFRDGLIESEKVGIDALIDKFSAEREVNRGKLLKDLERLDESRFAEDMAAMLGVDQLEEPVNG